MDRRLVYSLLSFLFTSLPVLAQPDSLWSRFYGSEHIELCYAGLQDTDGGYVLVGDVFSWETVDYDIWLVKTNGNGDSLWSRTFSGPRRDHCSSIQQTTDGGYVLAGDTRSFGAGENDFWLIKTDSTGDSLWSRTYGGEDAEIFEAVLQTTDGGFMMAGETFSYGSGNSDVWFVKTNASGDSLWSRTYGGSDWEDCHSLQPTTDGGYILAGSVTSSNIYYNMLLIKTDSEGNQIWTRTVDTGVSDRCYSVWQTTDGGYILGGERITSTNNSDILIVKISAEGDSLWSRIFGGSQSDKCECVQQTSDGGYVFVGNTFSYGSGASDIWLLRTNADGDSLWSRTFGGASEENCSWIEQMLDGSFALLGWSNSYGNTAADFWLIKTGPDPTVDVDNYSTPLPSSVYLSVFPNPFNNELTISLFGFSHEVRISLLNLLGQEVVAIHEGFNQNEHIQFLAPSTLSTGLYFIRAEDDMNAATRKIVLLK